MAYGWSTQKGVRTFCQGGEQALCGPSCVVLAIQWVKGDEFDAKAVSSRGTQKVMRLKFNPANINNPAMTKVMPDTQQDYGSLAGMGPEEVRATLQDHGIAANSHYPSGAGVFTYGELRAVLNNVGADKPVIVQLQNPSHFVICRKRAKGLLGGKNKFSIADPADGFIYAGAHVSGNRLIFSRYNTTITSLINVTGTFKQVGVKVM